jgi:hypothetical protein
MMLLSHDCVKMADTPKKLLKNCFICSKQRHYNLTSGVKSKDILEKISFLLKKNFSAVVEANSSLGICRSCNVKIVNTFEFVKLLETADEQCYGDYSCRFKRMAASPLTPKLAKPDSGRNSVLSITVFYP